jgi:hypothetical protein
VYSASASIQAFAHVAAEGERAASEASAAEIA